MPGLCLKCGRPVVKGGVPAANYEHVTLRIKLNDPNPVDGTGEADEPDELKTPMFTDMDVAVCSDCEITEEDWPQVISAHNEYFAMHGPMRLNGEVVGQIARKDRSEIQKMMQGGRCVGCHETIDDKWVMTSGLMLHEGCNLPPPAPVKQRAADPGKVVLRE